MHNKIAETRYRMGAVGTEPTQADGPLVGKSGQLAWRNPGQEIGVTLPYPHGQMLRRFDRLFGTPVPYIAAWDQALVTGLRSAGGIRPASSGPHRPPRPASSNTWPAPSRAVGVWVNDIVPETAVRRLGEAE
ncbi:MAG: hypothetical protein ACLPKE_07590 [Streptosporangiaceae bacterium]